MKINCKRMCGVLVLGLLAIHPSAQAQETLLTAEASVEAIGKDATEARTKAMAKAEIEALRSLMNQLAPDQGNQMLEKAQPADISKTVKGVQVMEEKIMVNSYRGKFSVSFYADKVYELLGQKPLSAAVEDGGPMKSVIVLPIYEETGTILLWEPGNPWRNAWNEVGLAIHGGRLVLPFGDKDDNNVVTAASVNASTYGMLQPLTQRYASDEFALVLARYNETQHTLQVVHRRLTATGNDIQTYSYRQDPQETKESMLGRVAQDIALKIVTHKEVALEKYTRAQSIKGRIQVLVPFTTINRWTLVRSKLQGLPMVDRIELMALASQQADLMVYYKSSPEDLAAAIQGQGFALLQNPDYWVVSAP